MTAPDPAAVSDEAVEAAQDALDAFYDDEPLDPSACGHGALGPGQTLCWQCRMTPVVAAALAVERPRIEAAARAEALREAVEVLRTTCGPLSGAEYAALVISRTCRDR